MASASSSPSAMPPTSPSPATQPEEAQNDPASSDGEEDEEEEEEEEEPQLKYERIGGDIGKVVRGDLVSTFCVGSKVIVFIPSQNFD
jgi:hypothetical protein